MVPLRPVPRTADYLRRLAPRVLAELGTKHLAARGCLSGVGRGAQVGKDAGVAARSRCATDLAAVGDEGNM